MLVSLGLRLDDLTVYRFGRRHSLERIAIFSNRLGRRGRFFN